MIVRAVGGACLGALLIFTGCSGDPEGGGSELQNQFVELLPEPWGLVAFEMDAPQQVGTEEEPASVTRFSASIAVERDTFEPIATRGELVMLRRVHEKGAKIEVVGVAATRGSGDTYEVQFDLDHDPFEDGGLVRSAFGHATAVEGAVDVREVIERHKAEAVDAAKELALLQRTGRG